MLITTSIALGTSVPAEADVTDCVEQQQQLTPTVDVEPTVEMLQCIATGDLTDCIKTFTGEAVWLWEVSGGPLPPYFLYDAGHLEIIWNCGEGTYLFEGVVSTVACSYTGNSGQDEGTIRFTETGALYSTEDCGAGSNPHPIIPRYCTGNARASTAEGQPTISGNTQLSAGLCVG